MVPVSPRPHAPHTPVDHLNSIFLKYFQNNSPRRAQNTLPWRTLHVRLSLVTWCAKIQKYLQWLKTIQKCKYFQSSWKILQKSLDTLNGVHQFDTFAVTWSQSYGSQPKCFLLFKRSFKNHKLLPIVTQQIFGRRCRNQFGKNIFDNRNEPILLIVY